MTEYLLQGLKPDGTVDWSENNSTKKLAFAKYVDLCEKKPQNKFRVVKKVTTEETIAESEDHRQTRFDFAQ